MANLKTCSQTKCAFHPTNDHPNHCPVCEECSAAPHVIDEDCTNCWNCLRDENFIRKGLPPQLLELKERMKEGGIKIEIKKLA